MGQGEEFEQLFRPPAGPDTVHIEVAGVDQQVLLDRQVGIQGVFLLADPHARADLAPVGPDIQVKNDHLAV